MTEKSNSRIFVRIIKLSLGASLAVFFSMFFSAGLFFVTSEQAFINTRVITLRSPISGTVRFSPLDIGQSLKRGQKVFYVSNPRFGNTESNTQYNSLQNLIDGVENEVVENELLTQKYEADYKKYKPKFPFNLPFIYSLFTQVSYAPIYQNPNQYLLEEVGAVSKRDYRQIKETLAILKATGEIKKRQLEHLRQRFEEIGHQLELQKSAKIVAPCSSVIWSLLARNGEQVDMGNEVMQIVNPDDIWVDAFFSERFAAILHPGMRVTVSAIGSKDKLEGEIAFIRSGTGRVIYNAAVEMPPMVLARRLVAVRIKVDWHNKFKATEFYGVGRSMIVSFRRYNIQE